MLRCRALLTGSALGAAVLLGGCDSAADPAPSASPTPSATTSSASPTPSPSPTPNQTSTIPAAARKNTPEGAEAFVKYFVKEFNTAWTTPVPGLIASLSDSRCQFCAKTEATSKTLKKRNERYDTPPLRLNRVQAFSGAPRGQIFVNAELVQNDAAVVDSSGDVVHRDERESLPSNVVLLWEDERWVVLELEEA